MRRYVRTVVAFLVSPALGVLATSLVLVVLTRRPVSWDELISMLLPAYFVAAVVAVPAFVMSRPWQVTSLWSYSVIGAIASCLIAVPLAGFFGVVQWSMLVLFAGAIAGLAFGLIVGTKSNNRWRGP